MNQLSELEAERHVNKSLLGEIARLRSKPMSFLRLKDNRIIRVNENVDYVDEQEVRDAIAHHEAEAQNHVEEVKRLTALLEVAPEGTSQEPPAAPAEPTPDALPLPASSITVEPVNVVSTAEAAPQIADVTPAPEVTEEAPQPITLQ